MDVCILGFVLGGNQQSQWQNNFFYIGNGEIQYSDEHHLLENIHNDLVRGFSRL